MDHGFVLCIKSATMQLSLGVGGVIVYAVCMLCCLPPEEQGDWRKESHRPECPVSKSVVLQQCITGCQHSINKHSPSFCQGCIHSHTLHNRHWDDSRWTYLTLYCVDKNTASYFGSACKLSLVLIPVQSTVVVQKDQMVWSEGQSLAFLCLQRQKSGPAFMVLVQKQDDLTKHNLACTRQGHDFVSRSQWEQALLQSAGNRHPGPAGETATLFHCNRVICRKRRRKRGAKMSKKIPFPFNLLTFGFSYNISLPMSCR